MSICEIHNVRFYKPKPKAIYCITLNEELHKIALSRSDASIEIWNIKHSPVLEKRIPPNAKNYSIEGLAWSNNRLFSVGLQAILFEFDLKKLRIQKQASVTGQTAFCLDSNKQNTHLAVGTEQGYLNIFSIADNELTFDKFLDKQEGRILCLKYDFSGDFIATGSMDTIRVWSVKTGHAIHKMTTGRSVASKATIVWCIAITSNFTIISGDSRGKLSFWDGHLGAQTESYQSHRADILSLCIANNDNELYCSGIDSNIVCYKNIAVRDDCHKWVKSIQRKAHDHDVRALAIYQNQLFSGGVDGYLACSYHPPKTLVKYPPVALHPDACAEISPKHRYILLKYPKYLELWTLGEKEEKRDDHDGPILSIKNQPKKVLILQRQINTAMGMKREAMLASAISPDGEYIAFSTVNMLRLFKFDFILDKEPMLEQCELPNEEPCLNMLFTPDSKQLILLRQEGGMDVLNIMDSVVMKVQTIDMHQLSQDTITFLKISPSGKYLAAANLASNISIWQQTSSKERTWLHYYKLPKYAASIPTAINFDSISTTLFVAYADHQILEFSLDSCMIFEFSEKVMEANIKLFTRNSSIHNMVHCPVNYSLILHDDSNIQIINHKKDKGPKRGKSSKKSRMENVEDSVELSTRAISKYKHLIYLGLLSETELVAVEVSPLTFLQQLPPGFKQNIFGTK